VTDTDKVHVDLSGASQTMLATLYAKALDADARAYRVMGKVMSLLPAMRNMAQCHRYAF
jgi:hypothetical protein